ncbi:T9SS type A sorting domain-containing protein [Cryomorphaceae bacterium 1068]|nr:T9SS type A sorting domain-containing protein [Cryomorphaceae bacterium 1068]
MPKFLLAFVSSCLLFGLSCQAQVQRDCLTNSGAITSGSASGLMVQQSIGQGSVIGNFKSNKITLRQGFLQPAVLTYRSAENKAVELEVFPNPFSESIQVQFTKAGEGLMQIRVFSADGALLRTFEKRRDGIIRLDLSGFAQGLYILQVDTDGGQYATKIQKL